MKIQDIIADIKENMYFESHNMREDLNDIKHILAEKGSNLEIVKKPKM
jgi:hypothetical protein